MTDPQETRSPDLLSEAVRLWLIVDEARKGGGGLRLSLDALARFMEPLAAAAERAPSSAPPAVPEIEEAREVSDAWGQYASIIGQARLEARSMISHEGDLHVLAANDRARAVVEAALRAEWVREAEGEVDRLTGELRDTLSGFLDIQPPSMRDPYPADAFDEWRVLRKEGRAILNDSALAESESIGDDGTR